MSDKYFEEFSFRAAEAFDDAPPPSKFTARRARHYRTAARIYFWSNIIQIIAWICFACHVADQAYKKGFADGMQYGIDLFYRN